MLSFDNYSSSTQLRLLIQGAPGSGKSALAARFPRPAFIDIDVNLSGVIDFLDAKGLPRPVGYYQLDKADDGKTTIGMPARFGRLETKLKEFQDDSNVDTIVIDSALGLVDIIIAETCKRLGKSELVGRDWGHFANVGKQFLQSLISTRKHVVMPIHEKRNKNPDGTIALPVKLPWPGQVGELMGAFFNCVWRCEATEKGFGTTATTQFLVRTKPNNMYELKDTLDMPNPWEFSWDFIQQKLNKRNQQPK